MKLLCLALLVLSILSSCSDDTGGIVPEGPRDPAPSYEALFATDTIKTIRIHITTAEWNGLLNDFDQNGRNELCRKATFYYGGTLSNAFRLDNVGFRLRGNWTSRRRPEEGSGLHSAANALVRAHFKIKFNESFEYNDAVYGSPSQDIPAIAANSGRELAPNVRQLNLKYNNDDPSCLKEVFVYDLFRRLGLETPRAAFARLYIKIGNEDEKYFGVYTLIENVDKNWVRKRYGTSGFLFKCLYQQAIADLSTTDTDGVDNAGMSGIEITDPSDPRWTGSPFRPSYDLKARTTDFAEGATNLNALITLLQGSPTDVQLSNAIDIGALLRVQAVNATLGMWDDYWRNGNNYYLLYRPTDNRWLFIPYDYDHAFDDTAHVGISPTSTASLTNWGAGGNGTPLLMQKVLAIPRYMAEYKTCLKQLRTENWCTWTGVNMRMQQLQAVFSPYVSGYQVVDPEPYDSDLAGQFQYYCNTRMTVSAAEAP